MNLDSIRTDVAYALRQLREHRCIDRALDALERVEEALRHQPTPESVARQAADLLRGTNRMVGGWLSLDGQEGD